MGGGEFELNMWGVGWDVGGRDLELREWMWGWGGGGGGRLWCIGGVGGVGRFYDG